MAQTAALILNRLGYEAQSETNPAKSIRRILDNEFDLLLTGNRMPGLNGFQVAHLLRTMGSMIPLFSTLEAAVLLIPTICDLWEFLGHQKPLSMTEFNLAFTRILHSHQN